MQDEEKTKEQLLAELRAIRKRVSWLERECVECRGAENAPRPGEVPLRVLMDHNPSLVFVKDEAGRYVYLNDAYEKKFALSRDWYGKTDFDFWPRQTAELFRANDTEILKSGRARQFLEDTTDFEGTRFCWLCYKFPIADSGNKKYIGGIGIDVTGRIRAEEALREREAELAEAQRVTKTGSWSFDIESGTIQGSDELYRLFEIEKSEAGGWFKSFLNRVHPGDRSMVLQVHGNARVLGEAFEVEYRVLAPSGVLKNIREMGYASRNAQGKVVRLFGTAQDITERKRVEEELRESERKLLSVVRAAPVGIGLTKNREILEVNDHLCAMTGYGREELMGAPGRVLYPTQEEYEWVGREKYRRIAESGTGTVETLWRKKDGTLMNVLLSSTPLDVSEPSIVTFTALDITERKDIERRTHRQSKVLEGINRTLRAALSAKTEERLGEVCLAVAEEITGSAFGFIAEANEGERLDVIAISDPGWESCRMPAPPGRKGPRDMKIHGVYGSVLLGGGGFYTNEPSSHPDSIGTPEGHPPLTAFLGVPLIQDGRTAGMIALGNRPGGYTDEQLEDLEALAPAVVQAFSRKRAEEALRQSEERYRGVVQNTTAVILRLDPQGIIRFANERALEYFGYSADELIGRHALGTIVPERETTGRDLTAMIDELLVDPERFHSNANENMRKNGERVWVEWTNSGLYDGEGNLSGLLAVGIDSTERKKAGEALRQSEQRYRMLHESLRDPFVQVAMDGRIVEFNDLYCRMLGYSREEIRGLTYQEVTPEHWHAFEDRIVREQIMVRGYSDIYEKEYRRKDGTVIPVELRTVLSRDESGQPNGMWGIVRDISMRRRMEEELRKAHSELEIRVQQRTAELERANAELRSVPCRLIAVQEEERKRLSSELHDSIGQTLAALKFNVELVLGLRERGDVDGAFGHLERFIPTLQRSIDETRAIYTGLRPKILEEMGLVTTIKWFAREFMKLYPAHHVELELGVEECEIPEHLKIALFRIAQEALNNVAKHSRAEWVDLSLLRVGDGIELTIRDDGVGADLDYILSHAATAKSLGLTSMRERAEFTGGSLTIESMPGEGTKVRATWPLLKRPAHEPISTSIH